MARSLAVRLAEDVDDIPEAALTEALSAFPVSFVVKWVGGAPIALYKLLVRDPDGSVRQIVPNPHPVGDNDGEITLPVGTYQPGQTIGVSFGIFASAAVPGLTTYLMTPTGAHRVAPPPPQVKALAQGDKWSEAHDAIQVR